MKKKTSKKPDTKLKAFRIHQLGTGDYFVAAAAIRPALRHHGEDSLGSLHEAERR